jgi:predicted O-methyltransferase YrrM
MTGHPDGSVDPWSLRDQTEDYPVEDEVVLATRDAAAQLGCVPVGPGAGAGLRFLAATISARAVVEIGTGAGVSGLWLLRGMSPDGVLTSIDIDPEYQRVARRAFTAAGHGPSRLRLINGLGLDVLPRLTDGGYDLVFVDTDPADHPRYLDEAVRLLRTGGIVVLNHALVAGVPEPESDVPAPAQLREAARQVRGDDRLVPMLLPLGDGLLTAVKKAD